MKTHKSWLWPDHSIGKRESRILREEHNALVNSHAELLDACKFILSRLAPPDAPAGTQCKLYSDSLSDMPDPLQQDPDETLTVVQMLQTIINRNAEPQPETPKARYTDPYHAGCGCSLDPTINQSSK